MDGMLTEPNLDLEIYVFSAYGTLNQNVFFPKNDKPSLSAFSWETREKHFSHSNIVHIDACKTLREST